MEPAAAVAAPPHLGRYDASPAPQVADPGRGWHDDAVTSGTNARDAVDRRLYLHVGHAKTGTSYLQTVFWGSQAALADAGLHLPLRGHNEHFLLALALRDDLDPALDSASAYALPDRLVAELRDAAPERVLISHEVLAVTDAAAAARFRSRLADQLEDYELHVVLTVRDLRRQIPAEWQQRVKTRSTVPYEEFLDLVVRRQAGGRNFWISQDTPDVAERWRGDLPPERVHIVTTPPRGAAPTLLLERFCRVFDVDPGLLDPDVARVNESLGVAQAELMRRVNVALGKRMTEPRAGYNRVARNGLANRVLAQQAGEQIDLPERLDEWCSDEAERIVAHIASQGYDVVGDLDDLLPVPRTGATNPFEVDEQELAAAAVGGLAALLNQRLEDVQRLQEVRRELRETKQQLARLEQDEQQRREQRGPLTDRARAVRERLRRM